MTLHLAHNWGVREMLIRVQPIEEKSLWERMIEDRCREWIYELESALTMTSS